MKALNNQLNKEVILKLAGITEAEYSEHLFEQAHLYLQKVLLADERQRAAFIKTSAFWKWWERQWQIREDVLLTKYFLEQLETPIEHTFSARWKMIHSLASLLHITPNRFAMRQMVNTFGKKCIQTQ